jgi:diguanylate cyclase (GGDEF)-like protein/PAS domain S-box-containing protein
MRTKTKIGRPKKRSRLQPSLPSADAHLQSLIETSSSWYYWEQDEHYRFTRLTGSVIERAGIDPRSYVGKTRWELNAVPVGDNGEWDAHKAVLEARQPFTDFILRNVTPNGRAHYISTSGQPVFDEGGTFKGYRGISKNITGRFWLNRRLTIEHRVTHLLAQANLLADALPSILRTICETLQWECGAYWELDSHASELRCLETWGVVLPGVDDFLAATKRSSPLPADASSTFRRLLAEGKPFWIDGIAEDESFKPVREAQRAGLRARFAVPIKVGAQTISVMEFYTRDPCSPRAELHEGAVYVGNAIGQFCERKKAEEELRRFRAAIDLSLDSIYLTDRSTMRHIDFNDVACKRAGYTRAELLQLGPQDVTTTDRHELERLYDRAIAAGAAGVKIEMTGRSKSNERAFVEVQHRALQVGDRWIIVTISRDITERKLAERTTRRLAGMYAALGATNEAIIRSTSLQELYQRVCDAAVHGGKFITAAILIPDADTAWANVAAITGEYAEKLRALRISVDAAMPEGRGLVGTAFRTVKPCVSNDYPNDDRTQPWRREAIEMGIASAAALPLVRNNRAIGVLLLDSGEKKTFDNEVVALLERIAENVVFALDNFEREAEREQAEERLHTSEEKHRAVLENMSEGYFEVDLAGNYTFFNDALARIHGCTHAEMLGLNYRDYAADEATAQRVYRIYNDVYRTGKPVPLHEWGFIRKDGTRGMWEQSVQLILDTQAKPIGFRGVTRDITNRRQAEEALRASEEKYRTILESIEDAYYEVDLKGDLVFFNTAFCRLLGYSKSELTGMNNRRYQTPEVSERVYKTFNEVYRTGVPTMAYDWEMVRSDGGKVLVEGSVHLIKDALGEPGGFRGILRDVGARRQMEQALRASEERFRSLTDLSSDWFWEQDAEFHFTKFEGKGVAESRYDPASAVLGKLSWELPGIVLESAAWEAHRATLLRHESFRDFEYSYRDPKGNLYYVSVNGASVFDKDGKLVGYRGTSRDITKRKHEERLLALEHAVTRGLAEADSTHKILQTVMRLVCESEQWESSGYWTMDERAQTLRLTMGWNGAGTQTATTEYYKDSLGVTLAANGPLGDVWRTAKPLWVGHVVRDSSPQWHQRFSYTSEHSSFAFPVMADGKIIGVLGFAGAIIHEPDERLLRTVGVIGNQVGQFLQRKQAERVLRESEARFRALTELSSDWYWEQDVEFRFTRVESRRGDDDESKRFLLGKRGWETGLQIEFEGGWEAHRALVEAHKPYRDVVMHATLPNGSRRYISVSGEPVFGAHSRFVGYRGASREITDQKLAEERIQYLATHDGLTGLPNRLMFSQLLTAAIHSARRYSRGLAVLFVDLDRFKLINDTLGHDAGDQLLQEIAQRLREALRDSDVIARLGGDEFVVLIPEVSEPTQVAIIAHKILSTVIRPMVLAGQECRATASIGISMYPTDAQDEQALMKNADMAMYSAKDEGKNNFQFYSTRVNTQSLERLALEANLRQALERREFALHYQPKLDLKTNTITGVEALLRWQNAALGAVSPAQFIPIAEETGLIVPIGKWVLNAACAQNMAWQHQGLPAVRMAVNLSARQFVDENLLADIAAALKESGMPPTLLELEITEGTVIHNPTRAIQLLNAIKEMGVHLAIDDFGTGYSSLGQLKHFPIDTLKVDRSFIRGIPNGAEDSAITEAIIVMAKTLGLTVVAEGVETPEQMEFLRTHRCDEMQGYYFSKPIPSDELTKLLRAHACAHDDPGALTSAAADRPRVSRRRIH